MDLKIRPTEQTAASRIREQFDRAERAEAALADLRAKVEALPVLFVGIEVLDRRNEDGLASWCQEDWMKPTDSDKVVRLSDVLALLAEKGQP